MNNTILFTPTNEQLVQIAQENPQLNEDIKASVLKNLCESGSKYITSRLQSRSNQIFDTLYKEVEKKYIKQNDWRNPAAFQPSLEKQLSQKIEASLDALYVEEFDAYLNSPAFKSLLQNKIKEKLVSAVLQQLESQIQAEAKKLTA